MKNLFDEILLRNQIKYIVFVFFFNLSKFVNYLKILEQKSLLKTGVER
jgi:hypothetical protein